MELNIRDLRRVSRLVNKIIKENKTKYKMPELIHYNGAPLSTLLDTFANTVEVLYQIENIELPVQVIEFYNETFVGDESQQECIEDEIIFDEDEIEPILDMAFDSLKNKKIKEPKPKPEKKPQTRKSHKPGPKKKRGPKPKPKSKVEDPNVVKKPRKKPGPKPGTKWKPNRKKRTKTYKTKPPRPNTITQAICKIIKENPQISRNEILDIIELEFPDKKRETLYYSISQCLGIARVFLELFGVKVGS